MPKVNAQITKLEFAPYHYFNKSVMLQGPTGSGKSRATLYLCNMLKDIIDIPVVFCPTNNEHGDYDKIIPDIMIRKHVTGDAITEIIQAQRDKREMINHSKKLIKYWKMLPGHEEIDSEYINEKAVIDERIAKNKASMTNSDFAREKHEKYLLRYSRNKKSRKLINKYIKKLYKDHGLIYGTENAGSNVAKELGIFHNYFRLTINMLLIIDDCSDQLENVAKESWVLLMTKNRHFNITVIMGAHTLNDIKVPALRTQPFWTIFTTVGTAQYYLNNSTTGVKGIIVPDPSSLAKAFNHDRDKETMTRVVIERESSSIFKFVYPLNFTFRIGNEAIWKLNDKMIAKKESKPVSIKASML